MENPFRKLRQLEEAKALEQRNNRDEQWRKDHPKEVQFKETYEQLTTVIYDYDPLVLKALKLLKDGYYGYYGSRVIYYAEQVRTQYIPPIENVENLWRLYEEPKWRLYSSYESARYDESRSIEENLVLVWFKYDYDKKEYYFLCRNEKTKIECRSGLTEQELIDALYKIHTQ